MTPDPFRVITWIKSHTAAERSFSRALKKYFADQADRFAKVVGENFPGGVTPDQTPLIINTHAEHEILRPIIRRNLSGLLIIGAKAEQRALERHQDAKAYEDDFAGLELPPETLAGLRRALDELEQQDYWLAIQSETEKSLRHIIEDGLLAKLDPYSISMQIRSQLGGVKARKRALTIARTETTSAMNAGHLAFAEELIEDGIVTGKQWLSIGDSDCRESHAALNNVIVPARENFSVGGFPAPYAGHPSLPGRERINCRCTWVSVFAEGLLGSASDPNGDNVNEDVLFAGN